MNDNIISEKKSAEYSGMYFSFLVLAVIITNLLVSFTIKSLCGNDNALNDFQCSDTYKYISYSLASFVILIVSVLFTMLRRSDIKDICAVKSAKPKYYLLAVLALIASFFGLSGLNEYFIDFLTKNFGYEYAAPILPELNCGNFILVVITVCILPAFFEELAFRGVLLYGLRGANAVVTALVGGACFSLFHMNPAQTPYQFAVGFTFAILSINSGSIFPSVGAHFVNNLIIICITYFFGGSLDLPCWLGIILTAAGVLAFIAFVVISVLENKKTKAKSGEIILSFLTYAAFGIIICAVMWVAGLL